MTKQDLSGWALGIIVWGTVLTLLYWVLWLGSWDRLSPEEKERVERRKRAFYQDMDHCRRVTAARVIDFTDAEFRRCATLLQDLDEQYREAAGAAGSRY